MSKYKNSEWVDYGRERANLYAVSEIDKAIESIVARLKTSWRVAYKKSRKDNEMWFALNCATHDDEVCAYRYSLQWLIQIKKRLS